MLIVYVIPQLSIVVQESEVRRFHEVLHSGLDCMTCLIVKFVFSFQRLMNKLMEPYNQLRLINLEIIRLGIGEEHPDWSKYVT